MLLLHEVRKMYNSRLVLEVPSLELEKGIYWVKGANGSGKTTLLKMIAGLIPFEGEITFNNTSLKKNPLPYRKNVSWAEAEPLFPAFVSGADLISLYRNIRKAPKQETEMLCALFKMNDFIGKATGTYSAGMIKKLSLVLAFIGNVPLIVLDEPLITLDQDAFKTVCNLIAEKHTTNGTTFLVSSHQEPDAETMLSATPFIISNGTVVTQ